MDQREKCADIGGTAQVTRLVSLLGLIDKETGRKLMNARYPLLYWTMHTYILCIHCLHQDKHKLRSCVLPRLVAAHLGRLYVTITYVCTLSTHTYVYVHTYVCTMYFSDIIHSTNNLLVQWDPLYTETFNTTVTRPGGSSTNLMYVRMYVHAHGNIFHE